MVELLLAVGGIAVLAGIVSNQLRAEHIEDGTEPGPVEQKAHNCVVALMLVLLVGLGVLIAGMGFAP